MRRREFISLIGGVAWPLAVRTQQPPPVIGFLSSGAERAFSSWVAGFTRGLADIGYIPGQNVLIEYRWADGQYDQLPAMADELVRQQIAVLVASGGTAVVRVARAATRNTPIVFAVADDPVANGLVSSLSRPSENITGVALLSIGLEAKRLGLLHELLPLAKSVAFLINDDNPESLTISKDAQEAANAVGMKVILLSAKTEREIDSAFKAISQERADALIIGTDPLYYIRRDQLITLAMSNRVPTIYFLREFVAAGGLMSYGTDFGDAYHQLGAYAGRILKGERPGDLPVMQTAKFEFALNLKAARVLGLTVPSGVLAIADEVIE
jgi:putative tryptophan/tyrosine transport system substrate-binding protein